MDKITVSFGPLYQILQAALGPNYYILELTNTMARNEEERKVSDNPFEVLIREVNKALETGKFE